MVLKKEIVQLSFSKEPFAGRQKCENIPFFCVFRSFSTDSINKHGIHDGYVSEKSTI